MDGMEWTNGMEWNGINDSQWKWNGQMKWTMNGNEGMDKRQQIYAFSLEEHFRRITSFSKWEIFPLGGC